MNLIRITDLDEEALRHYSSMSENELLRYYEPEPGLFIAESPNVVERALLAGYEPVSFILDERFLETREGRLLANYPEVPVYVGTFEQIRELTNTHLLQGMLSLMHRKKRSDIRELLKGRKRIAVLDDVENPTNVGAIMRSAAALGIEALLMTHDCCDPLYRRSLRVGMGTAFMLPWSSFTKIENWIDILHEEGFKLAAMALDKNSVSIDDRALRQEEKLAIVLGNEGYGMKPEDIARCDYTVMIPMYNGVDSLNVAAASAVAFWELCHGDGGSVQTKGRSSNGNI